MTYTIDTEKFEDELDHYAKLTAERWEHMGGLQELSEIAAMKVTMDSWVSEDETLLSGLVTLGGWLDGPRAVDYDDVADEIVNEICRRAKRIARRPEEREYYAVEDLGDGTRCIHHRHFYWLRWESDDDPMGEWCRTDLTFSVVPLSEVAGSGEDVWQLVDEADQSVTQYDYWLTAASALREQAGDEIHLPLSEVTADTPCGEYWCLRDE